MGPYRGGQDQYIRIPYADFNALKLPPSKEHESDFILLRRHLPTGWHGVSLPGFKPGDTIAVFGAGPVGLTAAYSAQLRGASRIYVVGRVPERLEASHRLLVFGLPQWHSTIAQTKNGTSSRGVRQDIKGNRPERRKELDS
jgi:threonine dehydrogenase-like Zn-dependent dehydrogenase